MKRRLMAVLMACVMTLSLLPISALAAENSGMEFYKTARDNGDGTYTISMEAWATGKTTTQENRSRSTLPSCWMFPARWMGRLQGRTRKRSMR